ncbi:MAG: SOS response-associated peptidase [Reichenbachiella sp.]
MIDRYAIFSDFKEINKRYGLSGEEFTVPNYNASPSQQLPVVTNLNKKEISFLFWGLNKAWSNNKSISNKLISVDVESVQSKGPLLSALMKRRCLIPADGFYFWKQYGKKRKTPHYFHKSDDELFSLIGIWEEFEDMDGNSNLTFKILERPNYSGIEEFGPKMPVIISSDDEIRFLDDYTSEEEIFNILLNDEAVAGLSNHPVSPHISNPSNNSKELIQAQSQVDQLGNYTLFD